MKKLLDSLRLCALQSRKMRNVSGFLQRHDENGRQSQAVCGFWALHPRKLGNVSGYLLFFCEFGRQSQAVCIFCALHARKLGNASGYLHCFMKLADSVRLFALLVHSTPENCGTSQAICIF